MNKKKLDLIPGAYLIEFRNISDSRGAFCEVFRRNWLNDTFSDEYQVNLSRSHSNVLRGLHFHRFQTDFWILLEGAIQLVLVDLRKGSPSFRKSLTRRIFSEDSTGLFIPPGVAHGYLALQKTTLLYLVNRYYDSSDEYGVRWDDPTIGINWETDSPVLSERDRNNLNLEQLDQELLISFTDKSGQ